MVPLDHAAIAQHLSATGVHAEVRGSGAARFVFAEHGHRAVEIAAAAEGVWVEYWNGEVPVLEWVFATSAEAVDNAKHWLNPTKPTP